MYMADDAAGATTSTDAGKDGAGTTTDTGNGAGKTFTQDDVNKIVAREKGQVQSQFADYDDLKAKAAKFDETAEAQKSEAQKAAEKLSKAEQRAATAEGELARYRAAAKAGLPIEHAHRIQGSNDTELEEDAKKLAEVLGGSGGTTFDGGVRETAPTADMDAFIRAGARRNKV